MSILSVRDLGFAYPGKPDLFTSVSFEIGPADRIGLVGFNGTGKTTLLQILAGRLQATTGSINRRRGLTVHLMDQATSAFKDVQLFEFVLMARPRLASLRARLVHPDVADLDRGALEDEYRWIGGHQAESEIERILRDLRFSNEELSLNLGSLSIGQAEKAALARAVFSPDDVLLLDEPTNHLDIDSREWLETYLATLAIPVVIASHDRVLLDTTTTRTIEIARGQVTVFEGNYSFYHASRCLLDRQRTIDYEAQQRRIATANASAAKRANLAHRVSSAPSHVRTGRDHYGRKAGKVARTSRLLRERVNREQPQSKPWEEQSIPDVDFSQIPRSSEIVLSALDIAKRYNDKVLYTNLSFTLIRGMHMGLIGPNGCGKSTLLRIILGLEALDSGTIQIGANVRMGYYSQEGEDLDQDKSALDLCGSNTAARTLLGCLRLSREKTTLPVSFLSTGERCKVALTRLLLSGTNFLLLDEPTNHLEIEALEAFESALHRFPGAVLLATHDRRFLNATTTTAIRL